MASAAGQKVWILQMVKISRTEGVSRPHAIPCSSPQNLRRHICDIIKKNYFDRLDSEYRRAIENALETKNYDDAIHIFRKAQLNNLTEIPMDFWWSDEPEVVL